jgi:hypothetical protein
VEQRMTENQLVIALTAAGLVAAVIAAVYSILAYRLKTGIEVRGSYSFMRSVAATQPYIHELVLENLKDRAVVLFSVYLELDHGYFLEIEDFADEPLVLRPFEVVRRAYGPINHYSEGMRHIKIESLLDNRKTQRRLILSTAQGRYVVSTWIARWSPLSHFFSNYLTGIIHPIRFLYEGTPYGGATKYIVRFKSRGGKDEVVPIYAGDHQIKKFRHFQLTADALASRDALETFLLEEATAGRLRCTDLEVFDLEQWRNEAFEDHGEASEAIELRRRGWFVYHIIGWFVTKQDDFRLWRVNRGHRAEHKRRQRAARQASQDR